MGVGALVFDRDHVLLVKRGAHPAKGYWSIPGGKLRRGESIVQAVEREMLEETGLRVRPSKLVAVYEKLPPDGSDEEHYVVLDYLCKAAGGRLCAGDDAAEVGWFRISTLHALQLTEGAAKVIVKAYRMAGGQ